MATCGSKTEFSDSLKLDCSICLSVYKDPKLLPCYHTFCMQCLDEYVTRHGKDGEFDCPLCRVSTVIPVGGIKEFQSNFYIHVGEVSAAETDDVDCDVCGSGQNATHYCIDFEEHFCGRCSNAHMKMKVSREHKILQINETCDNPLNGIRKIHRKSYCLYHNGEEIKMTCKECNYLLCVVCKLTEHENHNTSSIANEAKDRRPILSIKIFEAKNQVDKMKKEITQADECLNKIDKNYKKSIDDINKRVESVILDLQNDAEKLKEEAGTSSKNAKYYYVQKQKLLQSKVTENESIVKHAQHVVAFGDDMQVLDLKLQLKLQSLTSARYSSFRADYQPTVFKAGVQKIGSDVIGRNVIPKRNVTKIDEVIHQQSYAFTANANTISVDGDRLFAAFSDYNKLHCHYITASQVYEFCELSGNRSRCLGLTCVNGDIYFTSKNDRTIYKWGIIESTSVCTKLKTFLDYPHGLAYLAVCKVVIVCLLNSSEALQSNADQGFVVSMNLADQQVRVWKGKETPGATCVAVNKMEEIVCLGYPGAHRVTLNTLNGEILSEYTGVGCQGSPERFCPVSVYFDSEDCVIVADYSNNAVIRIDKCGSYVQCLVKEEAPMCVTFGDVDMLYVGYKNKNIARYQLSLSE